MGVGGAAVGAGSARAEGRGLGVLGAGFRGWIALVVGFAGRRECW